MPDVNINTKVNMSCYGDVAVGTSIGTDGIGTCVGIIVIGANRVFCGHMASNLQVPSATDPKYAQAQNSAQNQLQNAVTAANIGVVQAVHIADTNGDFSTRAIRAGFVAAYPTANTYDSSCIYYDGAAVIAMTANNLIGANTITTPGNFDAQ